MERKMPNLFQRKSDCCGCAACMSICGCNAIHMEIDREGFEYPFINHEKCIKCYLCIKVCPFKESEK